MHVKNGREEEEEERKKTCFWSIKFTCIHWTNKYRRVNVHNTYQGRQTKEGEGGNFNYLGLWSLWNTIWNYIQPLIKSQWPKISLVGVNWNEVEVKFYFPPSIGARKTKLSVDFRSIDNVGWGLILRQAYYLQPQVKWQLDMSSMIPCTYLDFRGLFHLSLAPFCFDIAQTYISN